MDESIFPFIDVDKSRLDIVKDICHFSTIDIAGYLAGFFPFND